MGKDDRSFWTLLRLLLRGAPKLNPASRALPIGDAIELDNETGTIRRSELIDLYKMAIEEYRFEVRLNWDRMQYYLVLNSALIAVVAGLLRVNSADRFLALVGFVCFIGAITSALGVLAIVRGHEYYHLAIYKKTLIEDLLGLTPGIPRYNSDRATLAVATTRNMAKTREILEETDTWLRNVRLQRGSIVSYVVAVLALMGAIQLGGMGFVTSEIVRSQLGTETSPTATATATASVSPSATALAAP